MLKTKKTVDKKLAKLSSKIEAIRKGLDNPSQSCQRLENLIQSTIKLKEDMADVAQIFVDLEKEMLPILEAQDKEQQKDLHGKGLIGLNEKFVKEEENKQEDETQKFGTLEIGVHTLKDKVKSEVNSLLNKMIDQLNRRDFECMKGKIQSSKFYKTFEKSKKNVTNRIDKASDLDSLLTITDSQTKVQKGIREEYIAIVQSACDKRLTEVEEIDSIAKKCDKMVKLNVHNYMFCLREREQVIDKKQSTFVNQPKIDEMNVGQSK